MDRVKKEFQLKHFGFNGPTAEHFCRFQWNWPGQPVSFLVYRVVLACYQLLWNVLVIAYWDDHRFYRPVDTSAKWPIYLSNWSFFFLTLYFVTAAVTSCYLMLQSSNKVSSAYQVSSTMVESVKIELVETAQPGQAAPDTHSVGESSPRADNVEDRPLPWYFKLTWLLQVVASAAVLFVAMGYWFFEYDPKLEKLQVFTIHVHAVGTVLALVDFLVMATPCRVLHFIYPMVYFTVYIAFSLVYYWAGGINPYGGKEMYEGLIDWEDGVTGSVVMSLVFIFVLGPCMHAMYYGLYLLRRLGAGEVAFACTGCRRAGNKSGDGNSVIAEQEAEQ